MCQMKSVDRQTIYREWFLTFFFKLVVPWAANLSGYDAEERYVGAYSRLATFAAYDS